MFLLTEVLLRLYLPPQSSCQSSVSFSRVAAMITVSVKMYFTIIIGTHPQPIGITVFAITIPWQNGASKRKVLTADWTLVSEPLPLGAVKRSFTTHS